MKKSMPTFPARLLPVFVFMLTAPVSYAGSATWKASPAAGDWNTAANWSPATVPNADADTATFDISNHSSSSWYASARNNLQHY